MEELNLIYDNGENLQFHIAEESQRISFHIHIIPETIVQLFVNHISACIVSDFQMKDEKGVPVIVQPENGVNIGGVFIFSEGSPLFKILCPMNCSGNISVVFQLISLDKNRLLCQRLLENFEKQKKEKEIMKSQMEAQMKRFQIVESQGAIISLDDQQIRWEQMLKTIINSQRKGSNFLEHFFRGI